MYQVPLKLGVGEAVSVQEIDWGDSVDTLTLPIVKCWSIEQFQQLAEESNSTIFARISQVHSSALHLSYKSLYIEYFFTREWMIFIITVEITNPISLVVENLQSQYPLNQYHDIIWQAEVLPDKICFEIGKNAILKPGHKKYLVS